MQLLKKFPAFYKTQMFIAVFTTARQLSLSWARTTLSTHSKPFKIHLNIILPFRHRFSSGLYPSSFPTISLHTLTCHIPRPPHFPTFDHPSNICWAAQIAKLHIVRSSVLAFVQSVTLHYMIKFEQSVQSVTLCYMITFEQSVQSVAFNFFCCVLSSG